MSTTAKREGDEYVLNGEKMYISGIREAKEQMPEGGGYLVLARTGPPAEHKMSFFHVPIESKGISTTLARRNGSTGDVVRRFRDERCPNVPVQRTSLAKRTGGSTMRWRALITHERL